MYGVARTARTFVFAVNAMCALVVEGVIIGVVSTQYDVVIGLCLCMNYFAI